MNLNYKNNILLTGVPRSGTNLICRLLNQIENVLALQEPMDVKSFGKLSTFLEIQERINDFFDETRTSAINRSVVWTKHVNGKMGDNNFESPNGVTNIRKNLEEKGYIHIDRELTSSMKLILKHNSAFTALLPEINLHFRIFAVVRNPLWTLASWNSVQFPAYHGHIPMGEQLDKRLAQDLSAIPDRIDRQIHIISWMFKHYSGLNKNQIIYYEDLIKSSGNVLKKIVPEASGLSESLVNQNQKNRYPLVDLIELKKRLLMVGGPFLDFYPAKLMFEQ